MATARILGIETSCDETAAAVVESGERVLSNVIFSQVVTHQAYGGVVPELASREHLRAIVPVVRRALAEAGADYSSIDAIAVTQGPGLAGALLVGISYAKALAYGLAKPLIAVNHLEGHIHAVLLEEKQKGNHEMRFPLLALVVSGGHTHLYLARRPGKPKDPSRNAGATAGAAQADEPPPNHWTYQNVGRTLDDAAGEAFDKVAKLLGLGYPGGPIIDRLAREGNPRAVKFAISQIKESSARPGAAATFNFSYSGIKTAALRHVVTHGMQAAIDERRRKLSAIPQPRMQDYLAHCDQATLDLIASFQHAMVEDLVGKTLEAARELGAASLFVTGGVAANSELRSTIEQRAAREGLPAYFPSLPLSTDNAAMIAAAAYPKFLAGDFAAPQFSAEASLALR